MQSFFASGTFSIQDVRLDRLCVYLFNILSDRCGQSVSLCFHLIMLDLFCLCTVETLLNDHYANRNFGLIFLACNWPICMVSDLPERYCPVSIATRLSLS